MRSFFKEMPRIIKFSLVFITLILMAVIGLYVTGNQHLLTAIRSTYVLGRTGPDIDNHLFFENRVVKAGDPKAWSRSAMFNTYELSNSDSIVLASYETTGFVVIQEGELRFEQYWETYSDSSYSNSFSMAKSITSLLVGAAIDEGLIASVDDPASKYLSDLQGTDRDKVTIKQLLQMTSGIGFDEHYGDPFGFMAQAYYGDELYAKTLNYKLETEPGTQWKYLGGNTLLLSYIVEEVTGKPLSKYASEKLWTPLQAQESAQWTYDETSNRERAYCCFYSNARDYARLGELVLCDGNWKGEQLISPEYIEESVSPAMVADASGSPVDFYGYQWWMTEWKGRKVEYMRGILGQYIFVIPETQTVIVRLGHKRSDERVNGVPKDVFDYLEIAEQIIR